MNPMVVLDLIKYPFRSFRSFRSFRFVSLNIISQGKFCLLFSLAFAGFRKGLSAENLLFRREGMSD